jgi:hypothetical protein
MSTTNPTGRLLSWVPAQPATAVVCVLVAAGILGWAWIVMPPALSGRSWLETGLAVVYLLTVLVWAATHPLHLRHKVKVHLTTLPLYLLAVLAPPAVAGAAAGLGVLVGQLRMRPQTGNLASDIATAVSRWIVCVLAVSLLAHWPALAGWAALPQLAGAALLMFVLDVLTAPFELAPMLGEPPLKIVSATVREGGLYEAAQYLAAILAAAAARYQVWSLGLLLVPIYLIYSAFRNAKEVHDGTFKLLESLADAVDLRDPDRWLFSVEDVAAVLRAFRVRFDDEAARWLCQLANHAIFDGASEDGGLRHALAVFRLAVVAHPTADAITAPMLKAAAALARGRGDAQRIAGELERMPAPLRQARAG